MKQRDDALDFVRLVAAVMIVVFHFNSMFAPKGDVSAGPLRYANGSFGNFGVALFFLLSGYALMLRYGQACPLKTFYKKRFLSIYPLYWLCFFSLFLYSDILHGNLPAGVPGWSIIWSVLALDGYLAGVVPTFYLLGEWFVGCIVLLYLVFPLLRAALLRAVRPAVCVTLALWAVWLAFYPAPFAREHDFITCIPIFMAGMVLAHTRAVHVPAWPVRLGARRVQVRALWAAGAVAALVLFVPLPLPQEVCDLLLGVAAFLLLHALGRALPKGAYRVIRPLAGAAYAVFLIHHVLLFIVFRPRVALPLTRPRAFLLCAVYLVVTFAAGTLLSTVWARVLAFWQRRGRRPAT